MNHRLPKNLLYESAQAREKRENIEFSKQNPPPVPLANLMSYNWPVHMNWGDWYLDENSYSLDLMPDCHFGVWDYEEPLYSINLLEVCSANDMVKWFFHLHGKNPHLYGENLVTDLFYAFHEIYNDFKFDLQKMGQIVCPTAVVKLHLKKYNQFKKVA